MDMDIGYGCDVVLTDTVGAVIIPRNVIISPSQKPDITARVNPDHPLAQGLVGYWPFNEGQGNIVHDLSPYGNHGIIQRMDLVTDWVTGEDGYSLSFVSAERGLVDLSSYLNLLDCSNFTLHIRLYDDDIAYYYYLQGANNSWDEHLVLRNWLHIVSFQVKDEYGNADGVSTYETVLKYVTYTCTKDDNGRLALYKDGQLMAEKLTSVVGKLGPVSYFWVGRRYGGSTMDGDVSYMALYHRALSADEIAELYESPYAMLEQPTKKYTLFGLSSISRDIGYSSDVIIVSRDNDAEYGSTIIVYVVSDVSYFSDVIILEQDKNIYYTVNIAILGTIDASYETDIFITDFMLRPDAPMGVGIQAPDYPMGVGIQSPSIPSGGAIMAPDYPIGVGIQSPSIPSGGVIMVPETPRGLHVVAGKNISLLRNNGYSANIILISKNISRGYAADILTA